MSTPWFAGVAGLVLVLIGALTLVELLVQRMTPAVRRLTGWMIVGIMGGLTWLACVVWALEMWA